jgi:hypothetical protein
MKTNNYSLLQDLLPVLHKHGIDIEGVSILPRRRRFTDPKDAPDRVEVVVDGLVREVA